MIFFLLCSHSLPNHIEPKSTETAWLHEWKLCIHHAKCSKFFIQNSEKYHFKKEKKRNSEKGYILLSYKLIHLSNCTIICSLWISIPPFSTHLQTLVAWVHLNWCLKNFLHDNKWCNLHPKHFTRLVSQHILVLPYGEELRAIKPTYIGSFVPYRKN